jgi:hypothetical protein
VSQRASEPREFASAGAGTRGALRVVMMKTLLAVVVAACGTDTPPQPPGENVYSIAVPDFTLQPGDEKFYCYYTTLPVAADTGVSSYASTMTPGSHHMILFFMPQPTEPDGTLTECQSFGTGSSLTSIPIFAYATQEPESTQLMPDGVGVALAANQPVMVNMHYFNVTDQPITASVHIDVHTYAPEVTFTPAHAFVTFASKIDIPPNSAGSAGGTCATPADANFIFMSTHSHRYTTDAQVLDGGDVVVDTTDWAHATIEKWLAPPYRQFASGALTYRCDYYNATSATVTVGESALTNEMCMAAGYFFPADRDIYCLDNSVISL